MKQVQDEQRISINSGANSGAGPEQVNLYDSFRLGAIHFCLLLLAVEGRRAQTSTANRALAQTRTRLVGGLTLSPRCAISIIWPAEPPAEVSCLNLCLRARWLVFLVLHKRNWRTMADEGPNKSSSQQE